MEFAENTKQAVCRMMYVLQSNIKISFCYAENIYELILFCSV